MTREPTRRTIAWLIRGDEGYGVRRMLLSLSGEVRRAGWQTPVVSVSAGPLAEECRTLGLPTVVLDRPPLVPLHRPRVRQAVNAVRLAWQSQAIARAAVPVLRELGIDAVHVIASNLVFAAGSAARTVGVPCFYEMARHLGAGLPWQLDQRLLHWHWIRTGTQPLAISHYVADTFGQRRVEPITLHLGTDPDRFDPARVEPLSRPALDLPADAIVLGVVGRLTEDKGQRRLLEAMLRPDLATAPLHLLLLGGPTDGPFAARLREIADAAGATPRLHLRGEVADPERYYHAIDVAVNCRQEPEAFGLSVVEAMMMERPVLVRALGGPAETVEDGATGWHVRDASVDAIADGLRRALADRPRWPAMGQAARTRACTHFSLRRQGERYRAVVERTIARRTA